MDIGKSTNLALVPAGILIAVAVVQFVLGLVPGVGGVLSCLTGPLGLVIQVAVLLWAGYNAAKAGGADLMGAALTGAIAGAISSIVGGILTLIAVVLGLGMGAATGADAGALAVGGGVSIGIVAVAVVIGVIVGAIMGAVLGAIGGFLGKR